MKEVKYLRKIHEISAAIPKVWNHQKSNKKYAKLSKHTKENCVKFGVSTFFSWFTYQVEHDQQLGQSLEKIYVVLASNSVNKSCKNVPRIWSKEKNWNPLLSADT